MDQLADILEVGRRLVEPYAAILLLDHEARRTEGVDVAVDRSGSDGEPGGDLLYRQVIVGRKQFHQSEQSLQLGLVHGQ